MNASIVLIEDEAILSRNICIYLGREGLDVAAAASGEEGLDLVERLHPQVVLLDYNLPGMDGLAVLGRIMSSAPATRVIMMTGSGSESTAVAALKGGAVDYLKKPVQLAALRLVIDRAMSRRRFEDAPAALRDASRRIMDTLDRRRSSDALDAQKTSWRGKLVAEPPAPAHVASSAASHAASREEGQTRLPTLLGSSQPMQTLKALIGKVIDADARNVGAESPIVLINGETGTGKELVARALHFDGRRRSSRFLEVNCAGIPAALLEAELFGHERGAFTDAKEAKPGMIEAAGDGTLFLDEIGDIDLAAQAKLLKVIEERRVRRLGSLQDRRVEARFIAATSCDLEQMVRDGRFRADLYFRLRMIRIQVPPLRERDGDALLLAEHFLELFGERYGKPGLRFDSAAIAVLTRHPWTGNVRELRNTIEQAVVLAEGVVITVADLGLSNVASEPASAECAQVEAAAQPHSDVIPFSTAERDMLLTALRKTDSNVSKAARLLGISRDTLRYRAKKYQIQH